MSNFMEIALFGLHYSELVPSFFDVKPIISEGSFMNLAKKNPSKRASMHRAHTKEFTVLENGKFGPSEQSRTPPHPKVTK